MNDLADALFWGLTGVGMMIGLGILLGFVTVANALTRLFNMLHNLNVQVNYIKEEDDGVEGKHVQKKG